MHTTHERWPRKRCNQISRITIRFSSFIRTITVQTRQQAKNLYIDRKMRLFRRAMRSLRSCRVVKGNLLEFQIKINFTQITEHFMGGTVGSWNLERILYRKLIKTKWNQEHSFNAITPMSAARSIVCVRGQMTMIHHWRQQRKSNVTA